MRKTKTFATDEEAKDYGKNFTPYQSEKIIVADSPVILCGTDKVYEEALWSNINELITDFIGTFVDNDALADKLIDENDDDIVSTTSEIRDKIIDIFTEITGLRFLNVNEKY